MTWCSKRKASVSPFSSAAVNSDRPRADSSWHLCLQQPRQFNRLGIVIVAARLERLVAVPFHSVTGQGHDRNRLRFGLGLQLPGCFPTISLRPIAGSLPHVSSNLIVEDDRPPRSCSTQVI